MMLSAPLAMASRTFHTRDSTKAIRGGKLRSEEENRQLSWKAKEKGKWGRKGFGAKSMGFL